MKSYYSLLIRMLTCLLVTVMACQSPSPAEEPFDMNSFFPLMGWDDVREEITIKKMAECGINSIAFVPPQFLDACQKYNVKAIVFDPRVTPAWDQPFNSEVAKPILEELIQKYNHHPAVYGYHLKDEPDGNQLAELGKSAAFVRERAPGKWPYINMTPGMGDWYDTVFLQLFVDECKGPVISYDNYCIGEQVEFSYGYWANIWDIRSASLRNNLPFHTIVLTAAHFQYRIPSADDLSLMVFGALAYGAKGIGYYKFVGETLSALDAPELGNFRGAPLDAFGEPTALYPILRNLNRRISNMAPVLLKLRSDDVYHIGEIPERNHGITEQSLIQGMESGEQFVIGEFTHVDDGSRWVMVVNKSLRSSTFCRPVYNKKYESVKYLCPISGETKLFSYPWYGLAPGQGVLLRLE